mmetsp:Transcript_4436/g.12422  ORF Transcript_4436/g.12422 Transcript_4436/m.12422 type:complete len:323 (-) Transcript_4436:354-1322(-)
MSNNRDYGWHPLAVVGAALCGGCLGAWLAMLAQRRGMQHPVLRTETPNPNWQVGQNQPHPFKSDEFTSYEVSQLSAAQLFPLIYSTVLPRPVALVCTMSKEGITNLSPYSFYGAVAADPPHVCIGMCWSRYKPSGFQDTTTNILETKEFTIGLISEWFVESANHTCGEFSAEVDELDLVGLTPVPSQKVKPPRVKESAAHLECKLVHTYEVRNASRKLTTTVAIGEVVMIHLNQNVVSSTPSGNPTADVTLLKPVSRLNGLTYGRTTGLFDLTRPVIHCPEVPAQVQHGSPQQQPQACQAAEGGKLPSAVLAMPTAPLRGSN